MATIELVPAPTIFWPTLIGQAVWVGVGLGRVPFVPLLGPTGYLRGIKGEEGASPSKLTYTDGTADTLVPQLVGAASMVLLGVVEAGAVMNDVKVAVTTLVISVVVSLGEVFNTGDV